MAKSIDVTLLIRLIIRKWFLFVLIGGVSLFFGIFLTVDVKPNKYEAYASISSLAAGSYKDSTEGAKLLQNYAELIYSSKIATEAKASLPESVSVEQIQGMVKYTFNVDSSILYITTESIEPQTSILVANAVADAFVAELGNITGGDTIRVYDRALTSTKTYDGANEQRKTRLTIPVVSLFLLLVVVVLWALFNGKIRSVGEASLNGQMPIIGVIPQI